MGYVLGVDVGTTYTAAAVARGGHVDMLGLSDRAPVIPTAVFLREDGGLLVGEPAEHRGRADPTRLAREFKRRVGDPTPIVLGGASLPAHLLVGHVLRWVVDHAAAREGSYPDTLAITHPANWGAYKLDLLRHAVHHAGFATYPVTFLTEPEAAAVHYSTQQRIQPGQLLAVYDLGGGTFDAAVLRRTPTRFEILGRPEGIEHLGGIDFDAAIVAHVDHALDGAVVSLDPDDLRNQVAVARLRDDCVRAKELLSTDTDVTISVRLPGVQDAVRLTRPEFERLVQPALAETVAALGRAIGSAGVTAHDVQAVLLVGGSTRIPLVAQTVRAILGRPAVVDAHPKHAVAKGAALAGAEGVAATPSLPSVAGPPVSATAPPAAAAAYAYPPRAPAPPPAALARRGRRTAGLVAAAVVLAAAVIGTMAAVLSDYPGGTGDPGTESSTSGVAAAPLPANGPIVVVPRGDGEFPGQAISELLVVDADGEALGTIDLPEPVDVGSHDQLVPTAAPGLAIIDPTGAAPLIVDAVALEAEPIAALAEGDTRPPLGLVGGGRRFTVLGRHLVDLETRDVAGFDDLGIPATADRFTFNVTESHLLVTDLLGGPAFIVPTEDPRERVEIPSVRSATFTPDGQEVIAANVSDDLQIQRIIRVPVDGGPEEFLGDGSAVAGLVGDRVLIGAAIDFSEPAEFESALLDPDTGEVTPVDMTDVRRALPMAAGSGRALVEAGDPAAGNFEADLWAWVDPETGEVELIAELAGHRLHDPDAPGGLAAARDGLLFSSSRGLARVDLASEAVDTIPLVGLGEGILGVTLAFPSADARWAVVYAREPALVDTVAETAEPVDDYSHFSPDGTAVLINRGEAELVIVPSGEGEEIPLGEAALGVWTAAADESDEDDGE
ncbi:MAG: Hsp70 family protein [Acidimicrobiales bacterium]